MCNRKIIEEEVACCERAAKCCWFELNEVKEEKKRGTEKGGQSDKEEENISSIAPSPTGPDKRVCDEVK